MAKKAESFLTHRVFEGMNVEADCAYPHIVLIYAETWSDGSTRIGRDTYYLNYDADVSPHDLLKEVKTIADFPALACLFNRYKNAAEKLGIQTRS